MQSPLMLNQVALHLLLRAVQLLLVVEPDGVAPCRRCKIGHCCFPGLLLELPWLLLEVAEPPWLLAEMAELPWLVLPEFMAEGQRFFAEVKATRDARKEDGAPVRKEPKRGKDSKLRHREPL